MDIKSKASITVTASLSAPEAVAAARNLSGFEAAVLDAAQAEAVKDATGLTFVARGVTFADDGSSVVELVYEKAEALPAADVAPEQADQAQAPDAPPAAVLQPGIMIPSAAV